MRPEDQLPSPPAAGEFPSSRTATHAEPERYKPPPTPVPDGSSWRVLALVAAVTIGCLVMVVVLGYVLLNVVTTSCTVGFAGTDLNITVEGGGGGPSCDQAVAKVGDQTGIGSAYRTSATGTLMCRYKLPDGLTYTVRDRGALKVYGNAACAALQSKTAEAKKAADMPDPEGPLAVTKSSNQVRRQ